MTLQTVTNLGTSGESPFQANLLEKLPAPDPAWSAAEYQAICDSFLEMLRSLDA